MILAALVVVFYLLFSYRYPDIMFWLALTIFVDPGGLVQTYIERTSIGGLKITDITFLLLLIPLISDKVNTADYFKNKDAKWFIQYAFFFAIAYHILIFGLLAHGKGMGELINFLQYQRLTLWGFLIIIPSYIFFLRSYKTFYKIAIYTSGALMFAYLLTLILKIDILPIWEFERSRGSGVMRVSLLSYGFADWLLIVFFSIYFFKLEIVHKRILTFIGITVFLAIIITLTRRSIFSTLFSIFTVFYIYQKYSGSNIFSLKIILRTIFLLIVLIGGLLIIKPNYIEYAQQTLSDTFTLVSKGMDVEGEEDVRFDNDIPKHLERFVHSPILGDGWDENWYSNDTENGGLSANDVPLTASLGMFGVLGLALFTPFYVRIAKKLIELNQLMKFFYRRKELKDIPILYGFATFFLVYFIVRFTINFMSYFEELTRGSHRIYTAIFTGFLLAIIHLLKVKKMNSQNSI